MSETFTKELRSVAIGAGIAAAGAVIAHFTGAAQSLGIPPELAAAVGAVLANALRKVAIAYGVPLP